MIKKISLTIYSAIIACSTATYGSSNPIPAPDEKLLPSISSKITENGIKIYALRTGYVGVKKTHRELDVPSILRLPTIFLQNKWANWMPVISYVVVHPEGIFIVDTGLPKDINEPGYYSCDKKNEVFYKRNMSFFVPKGDTLKEQLEAININPNDVKKVIITHFHADHLGGIGLFKNAKFITGPGNYPKHVGAFTCNLPNDFKPEEAKYVNDKIDNFEESESLTTDGSIRLVPLVGHTPGHLGMIIKDSNLSYLIAGDATFDQDQTERLAVCGVSENVKQAKGTQKMIRNQIRDYKTILLPAHDPKVLSDLLKSI